MVAHWLSQPCFDEDGVSLMLTAGIFFFSPVFYQYQVRFWLISGILRWGAPGGHAIFGGDNGSSLLYVFSIQQFPYGGQLGGI